MLELEMDKEIFIEDNKYKIINKVKFQEKAHFWIEYKLQRIKDSKCFYLSIESSGCIILYEIVEIKDIEILTSMKIYNDEFELFESGRAEILTYEGLTDVALREQVRYYEYNSKSDKSKVLSIEKWKDETEISIGKFISKLRINK